MGAPVFTGTWSARGNCPFPDVSSAANVAKSWWWSLKAHLLNEITTGQTGGAARTAGNTWTHYASSDGVSASSTTDLWGSTFNPSKLVNASAGTPHSWYIARSPDALGPIYLLMNLNHPSYLYYAGVAFSYTAPSLSGLTTTNPPIPAVVGFLGTTTSFGTTTNIDLGSGADAVVNGRYQTHFSVDLDGGFNFLVNRVNARADSAYFFSYVGIRKAVDAHPNDIYNTWIFGGGGANAAGVLNASSFYLGGVSYNGSLTVNDSAVGTGIFKPTFGGDTYTYVYDNMIKEYLAFPLLIWNTKTQTYGAYRGRIKDLWATSINVIGSYHSGSIYMVGGQQVGVVVGNLIIPFPDVPIKV